MTNLDFVFTCSCEVLPSGDLWLCDVCGTQLDLKDELTTDESTRLRRFDELLGMRTASEQQARERGISEKEITLARWAEMDYCAELDAQREQSNREHDLADLREDMRSGRELWSLTSAQDR